MFGLVVFLAVLDIAPAQYSGWQHSGSLYILTTPEGGHWSLPRDFTKWSACMPPEHITYFTRKGIKTLLEKHGIMVEKFYFSWKPGMKLIARKA